MRTLLFVLLFAAATSARAQVFAPFPEPLPEPVPPPPLVSAPEPPPDAPEPSAAPPEHTDAPFEQPAFPPEPPGTAHQEPPEVSPPSPAPLPGYTGPAQPPSERAQRYLEPSRYRSYAAGPGGPALIITELISGAIGGGLLGAEHGRDGSVPAGIVLGGLTLATASALYQYHVRVERNEGWLTAIAAAVGFTTGFGVATAQDLSRGDRATLTLASTQLAVVATLALTAMQPGDVSTGDTWLMGTTALYSFIFTGLLQGAMDTPSKDTHFTPTMAAPALGLIAGALLATPLEPDPRSMAAITLLPLAAGMGMARVLENLRSSTLSAVLLVTMGSTFLITTAFAALSDPFASDEPLRDSGLKAVPVPVVMAAGRDQGGLAAGPGLLMRF